MDKFIIPNWPAPKSVKAFSTTAYSGNLATHVGDDPNVVTQNRQRLVEELQLPSEPMWLEQTHSNSIIEVVGCCRAERGAPQNPSVRLIKNIRQHPTTIHADASYTTEPNITCAILTADCLPILLCNKSGTQVAAIHAGWRGLANSIIENTVRSFQDNRDDILAWLGPAIGPKHFEVGNDVYEQFTNVGCSQAKRGAESNTNPERRVLLSPKDAAHQKNFEQAFTKLPHSARDDEKHLCNIFTLATIQLKNLGIHNITSSGLCTYSNKELFSYRRKGQTGRQATIILIRPRH